MTDVEEVGPRFDQSGQHVNSQYNADTIVVNHVSQTPAVTPTPPRKLTPFTTGLLAAGITFVVVCCIAPAAVWIIESTISGNPTSGSSSPKNTTRSPSGSASRTITPAATSTAPVSPDGVTYECTGSAPGIEIDYGSSTGGMRATKLPFTAHEDVSASVQYYSISAQLKGSGFVTCTLTVTAGGRTTTSSGTARGGYNNARPQICRSFDVWNSCG